MGREVLVQYTGGEPTVYPKFKELLKHAHDRGIRQSIISNGSRTHRYWNDTAGYFEKVHLSFHPEYALEDPDRFILNAKQICRQTDLHVNVLMLPGYFPEILLVCSNLARACPDATILLKPIQKNFGEELYDYTESEIKILSTMHDFQTNVPTKKNYPTGQLKVTHRDGTQKTAVANSLVMEKANQWKGWNCQIGVETLNVDMNGNIWGGLCHVGGSYGNISTGFTLPTQGQVCTKQWCTCHLDIMVSKYSDLE
jgi:organic radical activating enzyme